jgi:hypothetical protein
MTMDSGPLNANGPNSLDLSQYMNSETHMPDGSPRPSKLKGKLLKVHVTDVSDGSPRPSTRKLSRKVTTIALAR